MGLNDLIAAWRDAHPEHHDAAWDKVRALCGSDAEIREAVTRQLQDWLGREASVTQRMTKEMGRVGIMVCDADRPENQDTLWQIRRRVERTVDALASLEGRA